MDIFFHEFKDKNRFYVGNLEHSKFFWLANDLTACFGRPIRKEQVFVGSIEKQPGFGGQLEISRFFGGPIRKQHVCLVLKNLGLKNLGF